MSQSLIAVTRSAFTLSHRRFDRNLWRLQGFRKTSANPKKSEIFCQAIISKPERSPITGKIAFAPRIFGGFGLAESEKPSYFVDGFPLLSKADVDCCLPVSNIGAGKSPQKHRSTESKQLFLIHSIKNFLFSLLESSVGCRFSGLRC